MASMLATKRAQKTDNTVYTVGEVADDFITGKPTHRAYKPRVIVEYRDDVAILHALMHILSS